MCVAMCSSKVDLSTHGKAMIRNFLFDISGCTGNYTLQGRELECIRYIKETVGGNKVLLLLSGGVDSTVCAALLHKALREDQVIAVHIDNGFMRKNESHRVAQSLEKIGIKLKGVNVGAQVHVYAAVVISCDRDPPVSSGDHDSTHGYQLPDQNNQDAVYDLQP
ncbi:unnamed protein product [Timema podura]|uniref:GMPS ATP-PPase domain-containing protein n=1 Tax=Timema podura TaxID=61482 RepID=A0ABN7PEN9_TIMPD|nr:unnamed protein product [Timema podura]